MKNSLLSIVKFILNFCVFLFGVALFTAIWQYLRLNNTSSAFFKASFMHSVYFLSPLACAAAIFSVFAFLMQKYKHYTGKIFISLAFLVILFGLVYALFIPYLYSKGSKIDSQIQRTEQKINKDKELVKFINPPVFIQATEEVIHPVLQDIYASYRKGYKQYLFFAGAFFLMVFSFWVCVICTDWKIINFLFMPFFLLLAMYGYTYIKSPEILYSIKNLLPLKLSTFYISALYFIIIAVLFFIYGGLLLLVRHIKYGAKRPKRPKKIRGQKRPKKVKAPKPPKKKKEKKAKVKKEKNTSRKPRQSRLKRRRDVEDLDNE